MGSKLSTGSVIIPEGLGSVVYDQKGMIHNHQIKSGSVHSLKGGKPFNQDSAVLCQGYGSEEGVFCGVFDGHGKKGHLVSKAIRIRLPILVLDQKNKSVSVSDESGSSLNEWKQACFNAFEQMDEEIKMVEKVDYSFSGSTAVVVLKQGDDLLIANLGDSRAILGTNGQNGVTAVQLTTELKPSIPEEAKRIRRFNGRVFARRNEAGFPRAWLPDSQSPGMAMSRSFGDLVMKHYGIISTPVITHHRITSDDLFILLATDGVWDVLSNEEVALIVWGAENEKMAAKNVVDAAVQAWKIKIPCDKRDDCTAVCYFLQKKTHHTQV
ncbi:unnamed protein product [Amaranthus hypochondriacus]